MATAMAEGGRVIMMQVSEAHSMFTGSYEILVLHVFIRLYCIEGPGGLKRWLEEVNSISVVRSCRIFAQNVLFDIEKWEMG